MVDLDQDERRKQGGAKERSNQEQHQPSLSLNAAENEILLKPTFWRTAGL